MSSSSSSSLLELELELDDVRVDVDFLLPELDDEVRLTLWGSVRVGVDLEDETDVFRCFVLSMLLSRVRELDELLVRLEEDIDLL